jgi:hypothetical protein
VRVCRLRKFHREIAMVEIANLWLPIVLSSVAVFIVSFLTWMVLPVHKGDWQKLPNEDHFVENLRSQEIPSGNYLFPFAKDNQARLAGSAERSEGT